MKLQSHQEISVKAQVGNGFGQRFRVMRRAQAALAILGALVAACTWTAEAQAQPVLITAPQTINPGTTNITSTAGGATVPLSTADITVRGTTLTVNGRHAINSLSIEALGVAAPGIVTHDAAHTSTFSGTTVRGLWLIVADSLTVDSLSRIDAGSRGYPSGQGPGVGNGTDQANQGTSGGGHGGRGGEAFRRRTGGAANGSMVAPVDFGSGGATAGTFSEYPVGGPGGGNVRLQVAGTCLVQGVVTVNGGDGLPGVSGIQGGGGAGGSVWISADIISGSGIISANGGGSTVSVAGGGGGGRIVVQTANYQLSQTPVAYGGLGFSNGGAGTVVLPISGYALPDATVDNGGRATVWETPFVNAGLRDLRVRGAAYASVVQAGPLRNLELATSGGVAAPSGLVIDNPLNANNSGTNMLTGQFTLPGLNVTGGTVLTHAPRATGFLSLVVLNDVTIDGVSRIDVSGMGFVDQSGPGAGNGNDQGNQGGGGGGHAGRGGDGFNNRTGGPVYGSASEPATFGSSGGILVASGTPVYIGGAGGGRLRMLVSGTLLLNGEIRANGFDGGAAFSNTGGGGGSGGAAWVTAGSILGSGSVSAMGGNGGRSNAGGGGGGYIKLDTACGTFNNSLTTNVLGGTGYQAGAAGIVTIGTYAVLVLTQPQSVVRCDSQPTSFSVVASGSGSLTYSWRKGGTPIDTNTNPSAATATLTLTNISAADAGIYDCIVTNACGSVTSNSASLDVFATCTDVTTNINPKGTYLRTSGDPDAQQPTKINLAAAGIAPGDRIIVTRLGQYEFNGLPGNLLNAAVGVFSSSDVVLADTSLLDRVPGAIDAGTDFVTATTFNGNLATDIPQDFFIGGNDIVVPAGAQWLIVCPNDVFYGDNTDSDSDYQIRLSRGTSTVAWAGPISASVESACLGQPYTMTVAAGGTSRTYQWYKFGLPIELSSNPTAANQSLVIPQFQVADGGTYTCVVSNAFQTQTSPPFIPVLNGPECNPCDYDYNQDDNVDLTDAQFMAQVFVGLLTPESNWLDGDLNGDENADLTDAQLLAAFVVSGTCGV